MTSTDSPKAKAVSSGGIFRAVLVLVSGTAVAHGLTALALPVLSRLYSPGDFGLLAVFSSTMSIVAAAACLRYDVAVSMPEHDEDAWHLLVLALLCALAVAAALAIAIALCPVAIANSLGQASLRDHLWLLPIGVLMSGAYSTLQAWTLRHKQFTLLARTRVAQSVLASGSQIGLGFAAAGPVGLLAGQVMNSGIASLSLGLLAMRQRAVVSWARLKRVAYEYRRFPQYSTGEALANSASSQLPIIVIAALATPAEAGYLMMAIYVMQAPMALIGAAITQVYLSRAPEEHRQGTLGAFTTEIIGNLIKTGVGPLVAAGMLSPFLFGLAFGTGWERAGWLVTLMTPWFVLQFLAAPVSMALHVTGHQRLALVLQLLGLLARVGAVLVAAHVIHGGISAAYAVSGAFFYLAYLAAVLHAVGVPAIAIGRKLRNAMPTVLIWILGAGAALLAIRAGQSI
ncbi:oligosaccharide flippase family protein [Roseateles asaccharophilus]|uniref:O-antigen/teichoic acid export membrane protein n=1 Tax=Roseateles asaccharophilus TaxID=582607 RepID=A0ABU2AC91_9BURK|nr:oligosaccharide flippase family protein [Roseateles asaccharophilus]MDR7334735.1 O-antigen/teichoic acid export membrane protein [Roseateles asaccharophilus]